MCVCVCVCACAFIARVRVCMRVCAYVPTFAVGALEIIFTPANVVRRPFVASSAILTRLR